MAWTKIRLCDRSVEAIQCAPGRHDVGPAMPAYVEVIGDDGRPMTAAEVSRWSPLAQYDERPDLNGLAETVRRLEEKVARMENKLKRLGKS